MRLPIPISNGVYKNVDGIELRDEQALLMDGYVGDLGQTLKRPGLETIISMTASFAVTTPRVDGAYWWHNKNCLILVVGGRTFKVTRVGMTYTATDLTGTLLAANNPVTFTTDGTYVFMASGGKINYTNGTATTAEISAGSVPTTVTHVAWLDGYLIANSTDNKFWWSDRDTPLTWSSLSFASAEGDADNITSLFVKNRELYLQGPKSLEIWENDGTPFRRIAGQFVQTGIIAPYSLVTTKKRYYWLDQDRMIVGSDGRAVSRIASQYDKELQKLGTISDCIGYSLVIDGTTLVIFNFPTSARTFVLNENNDTWSEWGSFQTSSGTYANYPVQSMCFCPDWGFTIGGSPNTTAFNKVSSSVYSDNGNPIRTRRLTGHIDYGSNSRKRSERIYVRLKRGIGTSTGTPVLSLRWLDDNKYWSRENEISLGDVGDTEIVTSFARTGMFNTRQYEWCCTDSVPFIFTLAEEEVTVLR